MVCFLSNYGSLFIIHFYKVFHVKSKMILNIHIYRSNTVSTSWFGDMKQPGLHRAMWEGLSKGGSDKTKEEDTWINTSSLNLKYT